MNATRWVLVAAVNELNAPVGKKLGSPVVFEPLPDRAKGTVPSTVCRSVRGNTCTSNMPKPPRTAVLALPKGSHENPTRGSKSRNDGLANNGEPVTGAA